MRRTLLTLPAVLVGLGLLAGSGFAGFQIGYREGARTGTGSAPAIERGERFRPEGPPAFGFGRDRDFGRQFHPGAGDSHFRGRGFGFLPFRWLGQIAFVALIVLLAVWLFTRNGWTLVRTRAAAPESKPDKADPPLQNE